MDKDTKVVIENSNIEIKENSRILLGITNVGLIGPIIANQMIDQIEDLEYIGFITSKHVPPIAVFYDGVLKKPFRIYYSSDFNTILILSEVPLDVSTAYSDLSGIICDWALSDDINASELLVFQGIQQKGMVDEFPVYYASEEGKDGAFEENGVKKIKKGILVGPEATFLNQALISKIRARALFTPVSPYPTPEGAAAIIDVLNKVFGFEIDTSELIEKGKEIKQKMLDLAQKAKQYQNKRIQGSSSQDASRMYQ